MLVSDIEAMLFSVFPRDLAEPWDRVGLSVGDPSAGVTGVACALDPLPDTLARAAAQGCNVLVTHHPAVLEAPGTVTPSVATSSLGGSLVWEAARLGVSLIAMHTNLDRSAAALAVPTRLTNLHAVGRLEEPDGCGAVLDGEGLTAAELAERFGEAYGCPPTLYGDPDAPCTRVGFCSGSLGDLWETAVAQGCQAVVTGELGYHRVLAAVEAGCAVILLGHDVSELPYARLLAASVAERQDSVPVVTLAEQAHWRICLDPRSIGR